jgi:hypothetical protein
MQFCARRLYRVFAASTVPATPSANEPRNVEAAWTRAEAELSELVVFETTLVKTGRGHVRAPLPFDPREKWGRKPRHYVRGTIAGAAFSGSIGFSTDGAFLVLSRAFREKARIDVGDVVNIAIEPDGGR